MLDGLLGRSVFYSKCKSLIIKTRRRIDVVTKKRNATQKFLRKDIADLLANGLEDNAFARAEGLIVELIISSCYDFIDHVCQIILKHLRILQEIRECPEDCREAVASLMFAAARFSDFPELRALRDLFQERYGSSVEYYVNQKLVENITPKPPSMEKKVQLLQEIASEFSVRWESRGFEERMSNSSISKQKLQRSPATPHVTQTKVPTPSAKEIIHKTVKGEVSVKKRSEATYQNKERQLVFEGIDDLKHNVPKRSEPTTDKYKTPLYREEAIQKREDHDIYLQKKEQKADVRDSEENVVVKLKTSSRAKRSESVDSQHKLDRHRQENVSEREVPKTLSRQKPNLGPVNNRRNSPSSVNDELSEHIHVRSMRKRQEDVTNGLKSNFRGGIPPPYIKPRKSKHKADSEENDTLTFNLASNGKRSGKPSTQPDFPGLQDGVMTPENADAGAQFTELYYRDDSSAEFASRRRSYRRKHSRSASSQDDKMNGEVGREEERVVRRVSTSRRKHESRKGLQILFDDHHYQKDEEERMIDKLLLHYSRKSTSGDPGKSRRVTNNVMNDASNSPHCKVLEGMTNMDEDSTSTTSRSMSLPSRQVPEPTPHKVFTRASSFQPDTPAKHVHPKLPDCDDLAVRFAALRTSKC